MHNSLKLLVLIFFVASAFTLLVLSLNIYSRKYVFSEKSKASNYPGYGVKKKFYDKFLFVDPIEGRPFITDVNDLEKYPPDKFRTIEIPKQQAMHYIVGKFIRWEDIEGFPDKYIVLSVENNEEKKIRLYFRNEEPEDLIYPIITKLGFEKVCIYCLLGKHTVMEYPDNMILEKVGFSNLSNEVAVGDVVVIRRVVGYPSWSVTDEGGNYVASWIILRRGANIKDIFDIYTNPNTK